VVAWERVLSLKEIKHLMANGPVPEPAELQIVAMETLPNGDLSLTIESANPGREHQVQQASGPGATTWDEVTGANLTGPVGNTITATIPAPADASMFYRAISLAPPPAFSDDFEAGNQGWTHGGTEDNWELGIPTTGPGSARSGQNVWATGLDSAYELGQNSWLRSPVIDLSGLANPSLTFWEYRDVEPLFQNLIVDFTALKVFDASAPQGEPLAVLIEADTGTTSEWTRRSFTLPAEVLGKSIILEFTLGADNWQDMPQYGWYIDDVMIQDQ
jgi:hypothetical protein